MGGGPWATLGGDSLALCHGTWVSFRWEEPMSTKRANEGKILFIQTFQVVHGGSQAQSLSLEALSSLGDGSLCPHQSRAQSSLSGFPEGQEGLQSWAQVPKYIQGSELFLWFRLLTPHRLWGLRWALPHSLKGQFLEETKKPHLLCG